MAELVHGETEAEARVLRGLRLALGLSVAILIVEAFGAYFSRSLSVTVDAVHNAPDILAFAVSWTALQATGRGSTKLYTFGMHRFEVFAALFNAAMVLGTGLVFGYAAGDTLLHGGAFAGPVDAVWMLAVALPTLSLRSANLVILGRIPRPTRDLNLVSVMVHLASDLLITASLLVAGALLLFRPGTASVDAIAALVISGILVYESLPMFRDGWEVLTERVPRNLSMDAIARTALSVPGVAGVHDVHVWAVCPTLVCMSAHVRVREMTLRQGMEVISDLRHRMERDFGILHSVFEMELGPPG